MHAYLPKLMTSKTFKDLSLATEQKRRPSALAAILQIDPTENNFNLERYISRVLTKTELLFTMAKTE